MFKRKPEAGDQEAETVIALHSQQHAMSYIPPVYLKNGPNQKRVCTNLGCCFLFILTIAALVYFYMGVYKEQHIQLLYTPVDADGKECGSADLNNFPLIYFATPNDKYLYRTVCVADCPKKETDKLNCAPNSVVTSCNQNPSVADISKQVLIYPSTVYGNNICLPNNKNYKDAIKSAIVAGEVQQALINIKFSMPIILLSAGIAFVLAFVLTILLGLLTTCVVWIFMLAYVGLTSFLSLYFMLYFLGDPFYYYQIPSLKSQEKEFEMNFYVLGISITFGMMAIYAILHVCCNFTKLKFMISLVKLATRFLYRNKTLLVVPLVFFFLVLGIIVIWLAASLFILSEKKSHEHQQHYMPFPQIYLSVELFLKLGIAFLGLIWMRQYVLSFARFLNISTATLWYFNANNDKQNGAYLLSSLKLALRFHNGSILAEAICRILFLWMSKIFNAMFDSLQRYRMRRHSPILKCLASTFLFVCCCCENYIMYINSYAFVQITMTSQEYFEASKAVHFTIKRNAKDFETLSGLGDTFTHFSKNFIFLCSTLGCFIYMAQTPLYDNIVTHPLYVLGMMAYLTLSIASLFMDMFGQTGDALILAYFTDCEVERFHYGGEEASSCPDDIRETVKHIREKQKLYYG